MVDYSIAIRIDGKPTYRCLACGRQFPSPMQGGHFTKRGGGSSCGPVVHWRLPVAAVTSIAFGAREEHPGASKRRAVAHALASLAIAIEESDVTGPELEAMEAVSVALLPSPSGRPVLRLELTTGDGSRHRFGVEEWAFNATPDLLTTGARDLVERALRTPDE